MKSENIDRLICIGLGLMMAGSLFISASAEHYKPVLPPGGYQANPVVRSFDYGNGFTEHNFSDGSRGMTYDFDNGFKSTTIITPEGEMRNFETYDFGDGFSETREW